MPATTTPAAVATTDIKGLELLARGKVRDIYVVDEDHLLIVATDRISAFDIVLDPAVPDKGRVLTALTVFWIRFLEMLEERIGGLRNHLVAWEPRYWPDAARAQRGLLVGRALLVRRAPVLPVECVVRGYMAGSVWKDYEKTGKVAGVDAPRGLAQGDRFPEPLFTPTTKAPKGQHDENISYAEVERLVGAERAAAIRDLSIRIYQTAADFAATRGVVLCDTKFEFGVTEKSDELFLIDEVLTPDSSRYWSKREYEARKPGTLPEPIDKQVVRNALLKTDWNKQPPAPRLSDDVVAKTRAAYRDIYRILTGVELDDDPEEALLAADRAGTEAAGDLLLQGGHGEGS